MAIASFAAAGLALIAMFLSLRPVALWHFQIPSSLGSFGNFDIASAPGVSASKTLPAKDIQTVKVIAPLGAVNLSTGADQIKLHWTVAAHPEKAVTTSAANGVLTIRFSPPHVVGANDDRLDITIPAGLTADANVSTGALWIQGTYKSVSATVQTGALGVSSFQGGLSAHDNLGPIQVQDATIVGPLTLIDGTGPIDFTGDPGLAATIQDHLGPVLLNIAPKGRLTVRAQVQLGSFTSNFAHLGNGGSGTYSGTIGSGSPGYLHVSAQTGPVTISKTSQ